MESILRSLRSIIPTISDRPSEPIEENFSGRQAYLKAKIEWRHFPHLNVPAHDEDIALLRSAFPSTALPISVVRLYEFANGDVDGALKPGTRFNAISYALELQKVYSDMVQDEAPLELKLFLPIFTSNQIEIGVFVHNSSPRIYGVDVWGMKMYLMFSSVENMLRVWLNCREHGAYSKGKSHRNDPTSYLKAEKEIVQQCESDGVFPLVKKKRVTVFDLFNNKHWPADARTEI